MNNQWFHYNNKHSHSVRSTFRINEDQRFDSYTVCLEVPDYQTFINLIQPFSPKTINLKIGIAKVHPKEPYIKKIGRDLSESRLKEMTFTLIRTDYTVGNSTNDSEVDLYFRADAEGCNLSIRLVSRNNKPRFISFWFV